MNSFYEKISKSRFYAFGDKLGDLLIASVLWLLLCLPIVTFIPSTAALYYTKHKHKSSGESVSKLFMRSFKRNLKQGVIINILYLLYSCIAGMSIFFGYFGIGDIKLPDMYFPFSFVTLIPIVFTMPFAIALIARFDNSIKTTLINSFTLSVMNLISTIGIWLIMIISLVVMVAFFPAALLLPAISAGFIVPMCEKVFAYALGTQKKRNEDKNTSDIDEYTDDEYIEESDDSETIDDNTEEDSYNE